MLKEVDDLKLAFLEMERNEKLNLTSSLPIIDELAQELKRFRETIINSKLSAESTFKEYYPSFVISVVLQNMKNRLNEAEKMGDNPIIALNSLKVITPIKEIISNLGNYRNSDSIELATNLQAEATKNNLFVIDSNRLKAADSVLRDIFSEKIA